MRRRFAVPLILICAFLPWYALMPKVPDVSFPAVESAVIDFRHDADWFGGISGLEVFGGGAQYLAVTDRGHLFGGSLARKEGRLITVTVDNQRSVIADDMTEFEFPHGDAEGLAAAPDRRLHVSYEHAHRVQSFGTWEDDPVWTGYAPSWNALSKNGGLEALAVDNEGTIFAIPERVASGAWAALVYRYGDDGQWQQPFTLPVDSGFSPVGADFGPDGRLYILERGLYPFGFFSRVRSMQVTPDGVEDTRVELHTPFRKYGNLEGIAVWQDENDKLRLTMVSDDNFQWFLPSQIVEYVIDPALANRARAD